MILMVDNYDSFTYNLVQYFGELGEKLVVVRNDAPELDRIEELSPTEIVVSPGPCTPREAGMSCDIIKKFSGRIPILGVCLGHQCIGEVFGAKITRARRIMHGKTSPVYHNEEGIFKGIENPFEGGRYHSLIISPDVFPDCLKVTAKTKQGEIMAVEHKSLPVWGVQFHPESILTKPGKSVLKNFLHIARRR